MRTNSAIIGLVLVVIVMAGYIYLTSDHTSEEITVECYLEKAPYASMNGDTPVISYTMHFKFTSNKEEKVMSDKPLLVLTKGDKSYTFSHGSDIGKYNSGKDNSVGYRNQPTPEVLGEGYLDDWQWHFELTESMKKAGNYKLIE